jgi:hypothetical protein
MRIEHKLSPAVAAYAQRTMEQMNDLRRQYLAALGTAKELEIKMELLRQALGQQLAIVEEAEDLPRPVAPYQLSPDGTRLVGETGGDTPAAAAPPAGAQLVNGEAAHA